MATNSRMSSPGAAAGRPGRSIPSRAGRVLESKPVREECAGPLSTSAR